MRRMMKTKMTVMTTAGAKAAGFLAIWSDVELAGETDYLHWLTREHAQERLGVPGFLAVRVFRADTEGFARYFILYRLSGSDVVASADYLARLNAPSAWSQRIMPRLKGFVRGGGSIAHESGAGEGAFVLPILFGAAEIARVRAAAQDVCAHDRMISARILVAEQSTTAITTNEKSMRQGDASFEALLLLEAADENALKQACAVTRVADENALRFQQIFSLARREI